MKQYIKNGQIAGGIVIIDGRQVFNPTEEILLAAGYKEYTPEYEQAYKERHYTNEDIRQLRQDAYKQRSDSLYMAYQKYLAKGDEERAEQARLRWLEEVDMIDAEFPYNEEDSNE